MLGELLAVNLFSSQDLGSSCVPEVPTLPRPVLSLGPVPDSVSLGPSPRTIMCMPWEPRRGTPGRVWSQTGQAFSTPVSVPTAAQCPSWTPEPALGVR